MTVDSSYEVLGPRYFIIGINNPIFDAHFQSFFVPSTNFLVMIYRGKTVAYVFFVRTALFSKTSQLLTHLERQNHE